jgi:hypothetical protein
MASTRLCKTSLNGGSAGGDFASGRTGRAAGLPEDHGAHRGKQTATCIIVRRSFTA